jgi:cell division transport system ATP-binding protein
MIEFRSVRKEYADLTALDEISFTIGDGEFVFIVGRSGAGKTTVTKCLIREEEVDSGAIIVNGEDITKLADFQIPYYRRTIGMVFQDFKLFSDKTAYENVAFAMRVVGIPGGEIRKRVPMLLRTVSIDEKAGHFPRELSGGEQQRVALARAIANNPDIIVADEPTGNVDPEMSMIIMNMLLKINRLLRKTVIVVTYEEGLVRELGQRVITIDSGRVVSDVPARAEQEVRR